MYEHERPLRRFIVTMAVIVVLVGVAMAGGLTAKGTLEAAERRQEQEHQQELSNPTQPATNATYAYPGLGPTSISDIVKQAGGAVVYISTTQQVQRPTNDLFMFPFFWPDSLSVPQETQGLGTGFIISEDGLIVTNQHVIDQATEIQVTVDGYEQPFTATVVGQDADLDLAILKIEAPNSLPVLPLGDSDQTEVGEWVIAIGNPLGLDHTVTVGVISAKERPITVKGKNFKGLLQTDAAINPGNSGGPLLNLKGEVIGINTAINAEGQGLGFAITSNQLAAVKEELIEKGKIIRPYLGVYMQDLNEALAKQFGLNEPAGALISQVAPGGPAQKAGLQRGDVILEINGEAVKTAEDVVKQVGQAEIGDQLNLLIHRSGTARYVTVTVGERP